MLLLDMLADHLLPLLYATTALAALSVMPACSARRTAQTVTAEAKSASISLTVSEVEPGHHRVEVLVRLGDAETPFILDTGAPKTTLTANERTARYVATRSSESKGVAGVGVACEEILVDSLELGRRRLLQFPASRCSQSRTRNLLGLDALGDRFRIDLRRRLLTLDPQPEQASMAASLRRLRAGHLTIPARLGDVDVHVLFDTGADTTIVDSAFVAAHPGSFTKKRTEEGRDGTGTAIASEVFQLSSVRIGSLELRDIEIATIPFSEAMRRDMGSGTPAILGTNAIEPGVWTFDLRTNRWSVEPY